MSWRGGWVGWRNRRLTSPAFQAWAAAFPLTRPRARREAAALFDLVAGFVHSQVLAALVELGWLERLADRPADAAALAQAGAMPVAAAERLLRAAAALGLVEAMAGGWTLGPRGAALLGSRGIMAMIAHHRALYADLADPLALLRRGGGGGRLQDYWSYARDGASDDGSVAAYSQLMRVSQPMVAAEVIASGVLRGHRRLLDIGGGEGAFVAAVAAAQPNLELAVFDLPAVVVRARVELDTQGLDAVATVAGNFFDDVLPSGYDAVTLVRILHDHDDGAALALLTNVRRSMQPGATLILAEPMAGLAGDRVAESYFGLYLLAMGQGRARRPAEIAAMLRSTGFAGVRNVTTRMPLITGIIIARV